MRTLIVSGGNISTDFALSFIKKIKADYIIGVDRGLAFCYENSVRPDYIVGDFDSLSPEILSWYQERSEIPIRKYNPIKDATDTMIALEHAIELCSEKKNSSEKYEWKLRGSESSNQENDNLEKDNLKDSNSKNDNSEIWILGATGTRVDHVLCNLQILKNAWEKQIPAWMVDEHNLIGLPVGQRIELKRTEQFGQFVSFFPLEEKVEGFTLEGFKYPLQDYCLINKAGLGVSNEITEETAVANWKKGILVMIQSRD